MIDLDRAIEASRGGRDGAPTDPSMTRQRIIASVQRQERRRRSSWFVGVVAALLLTNMTTWAWFTGRLAPLGTEETSASGSRAHSDEVTDDVAPRDVVMGVEPAELVAPAELAEPTEPAEPSQRPIDRPIVERANEPSSLDQALDELNMVAPPPLPVPSVDDAERRAFSVAHGLHFDTDDTARALDAWNDFLFQYPHGQFEPEARFNRAICQLRLGRDLDVARSTLETFAGGAFGGVRRRDAQLLLDAMARGAIRR